MRRKDREIADMNDIMDIVRKSKVCRVAFFDDGFPYIIPLNFGFEEDGGKLTLWFHCAKEGKKLELLSKNNRVAFEMDIMGRFIEGDMACASTMTYESVCGAGIMEMAGAGEKRHALQLLMRQYSEKKEFEFDESEVEAITALKLTVTEISGKRLTTS